MIGRARARSRIRISDNDPIRPGNSVADSIKRIIIKPSENESINIKPSANINVDTPTESGDKCVSSDMNKMSINNEVIKSKNKGFISQGTYGTKIELLANFFEMRQRENFNLYQYHVDFQPIVDNIRLRKYLLKCHSDLIGSVKAFDGMVLFCNRKFENEVTELYSEKKDGDKIKVIIKYITPVSRNSPTLLQIYNLIMKRILHIIGMSLIGRNYYDPNKGHQIKKHSLDIWPGFCTSINLFEKSILLQADISHKILRSDTVLSNLYELYRINKVNFKQAAEKKFIGQIVLTRYNNKTYRIDDINWDGSPTMKFEKRGELISFIEYYKNQYNIDIRDIKQPLLISNPKKKDIRAGITGPILLIPELCNLSGLSDEALSDFNIMKDITEYTRIPPQQRQNTLIQFVKSIYENEEAKNHLNDWGLQFSSSLLNIDARILPRESIFQSAKKTDYKVNDAEWNSLIRGNRLKSTINLNKWCIIFFQKNESVTTEFLNTLYKVSTPMGIQIDKPKIMMLSDDRTQTYVKALSECCKDDLQIIICIVPSRLKDRYDAIKKYCYLNIGVLCQVIFAGTLSKKAMLMSVTTKISIQLNCKLGGEAWSVDIPLKDFMVIGFDTYHDSLKKGMSVGGFVSSLNSSLTKYYSKCTFQLNSQELFDQLLTCTIAALKEYIKFNGKLPDRILVYRDGVGDGQLDYILKHELPQFFEAFKKLRSDYKPRFGFIIVKKRINHRFFARKDNVSINPPPGTVIDNDVTRSEWYDFFIVSQSVKQGTVTPTSYNVIYDTTGLKADHIQRITYKLCHLYYNWPGTVRVPAPCQYAHKLAYMTGQSLHADAKPILADKLFYL